MYCKFGGTLEEAVRYRFVCGLQHEAIQLRLLLEHALTYENALEITQGMEAADSTTISLRGCEPPINNVTN